MFIIHALSGPKVLVDLDGVLADFRAGLQNRLAEELGSGFEPVPLARCDKFILQDVFVGGVSAIAHRIAREPGFYLNLPPFPGALDALSELAQVYPTYLCSSPDNQNPTCASDKLAWVRRYLGREWLQRTCLVADKTLVRGAFLIDDKPGVTGALMPTWKHLLFDNGCNYCSPRCGVVSITWQNWRQVIERQLQLTEYQLFVARGMAAGRAWRCPSSQDD